MDQKLASELLQSKPDGTTLLTTREERLLIYFLVCTTWAPLSERIYLYFNKSERPKVFPIRYEYGSNLPILKMWNVSILDEKRWKN